MKRRCGICGAIVLSESRCTAECERTMMERAEASIKNQAGEIQGKDHDRSRQRSHPEG